MDYATKYPRPKLEGWALQQDFQVESGLVSTPRLYSCDICGKRTGFRGGYRLSTPICSEACYGQTPIEEDDTSHGVDVPLIQKSLARLVSEVERSLDMGKAEGGDDPTGSTDQHATEDA